MPPGDYPATRTGLLLVDSYNDFLGDGGKLWPTIKAVTEAVDLIEHLRALADAARRSGIVIFYVPHRRWHEGDYDGWRHPSPWQIASDRAEVFAEGTWGGDWHPDLAPQPSDVIIQMILSSSCTIVVIARWRLAAYCAPIQVFDPTSLTATFEKKMCTDLPLAVPR